MIQRSTKKDFSKKGQGALEYLLLIGGAVLIATIVLLIIISSTGSTNTIIGSNLNTFQNKITLGGGTPPAPNCGNGTIQSPEQCDGSAFAGGNADCSAWGAFQAGTNVTCNAAACTVNTSACIPSVPVDSIYLQAETGVFTNPGLQTLTQGLNTFLETTAGCAVPNNEATYSITLSNSGTDDYASWVRVRNLDATQTYSVRSTIDPQAVGAVVPIGPAAGFTWVRTTADIISMPTGLQTARIRIPCGAIVGQLRLDQMLFTTDLLCDPNVATC
jgi:hypothetical protein